jgi:hypothetical protein
VSYVRDVATNTNADRPVIDACGGTRPLNSYGMTVSIPKITANSTAATVAEGGDPTGTTAITSAYVNATVIKKAGFQRYSQSSFSTDQIHHSMKLCFKIFAMRMLRQLMRM